MAKPPTYSTTAPVYTAGNVTITGGASLTYATGTNWTTTISEPFYTKKPKVNITDQDITLDGLSLRESMQAIQDELMIPTRLNRNEQLEQEFAELKAAAKNYYELERKFLEQKKMWETLKHTDNK